VHGWGVVGKKGWTFKKGFGAMDLRRGGSRPHWSTRASMVGWTSKRKSRGVVGDQQTGAVRGGKGLTSMKAKGGKVGYDKTGSRGRGNSGKRILKRKRKRGQKTLGQKNRRIGQKEICWRKELTRGGSTPGGKRKGP